MGLLSDIVSLGTSLYADNENIQNVRDVGSDALTLSQTLGDKSTERSRFKPFATSSVMGTSGTTRDPVTGGTAFNMNLSPDADALSKQLVNSGRGFVSGLGNIGQRETDIFDRLEALQQPGRERDMLGLEEMLFNQGRSGVRTSAFGGTPEQLAMAKAIEESRLSSGVQSIGLAGQEQAREAQIGQSLIEAGYRPQQELLQSITAGMPIADIIGAGDRQGAQLGSALSEAGLQAKLGAEGVAANLQAGQMNTITAALQSLLGGAATQSSSVLGQGSEGNFFSNLIDKYYSQGF